MKPDSRQNAKVRGYASVYCALLIAAIDAHAWAGAWTLPKGDTQIISTTTYSKANTLLGEDPGMDSEVRFRKFDSQLYGEHGWRDGITLISAISLQQVDYEATFGPDRFSGVGDTQFGARFRLPLSDAFAVSVQPSVIVSGGEDIPDANLGAQRVSYELRLLAGRAFQIPLPLQDTAVSGFIDGQMARRFRPSGEPDGVRLDMTLGLKPWPKHELFSQVFYTSNSGRRDSLDVVLANKSTKFQGAWLYRFSPKQAVQVGAYRTLTGENIVQESAGFIGFWQML